MLGWRGQAPFGLPTPPLPLRGLDRDAEYREPRTGVRHSGAVLLEHGLDLPLPWGDWSSAAVHLVRV